MVTREPCVFFTTTPVACARGNTVPRTACIILTRAVADALPPCARRGVKNVRCVRVAAPRGAASAGSVAEGGEAASTHHTADTFFLCSVMMVGARGVGKTSICQLLEHRHTPGRQKHTLGVELHTVHLDSGTADAVCATAMLSPVASVMLSGAVSDTFMFWDTGAPYPLDSAHLFRASVGGADPLPHYWRPPFPADPPSARWHGQRGYPPTVRHPPVLCGGSLLITRFCATRLTKHTPAPSRPLVRPPCIAVVC